MRAVVTRDDIVSVGVRRDFCAIKGDADWIFVAVAHSEGDIAGVMPAVHNALNDRRCFVDVAERRADVGHIILRARLAVTSVVLNAHIDSKTVHISDILHRIRPDAHGILRRHVQANLLPVCDRCDLAFCQRAIGNIIRQPFQPALAILRRQRHRRAGIHRDALADRAKIRIRHAVDAERPRRRHAVCLVNRLPANVAGLRLRVRRLRIAAEGMVRAMGVGEIRVRERALAVEGERRVVFEGARCVVEETPAVTDGDLRRLIFVDQHAAGIFKGSGVADGQRGVVGKGSVVFQIGGEEPHRAAVFQRAIVVESGDLERQTALVVDPAGVVKFRAAERHAAAIVNRRACIDSDREIAVADRPGVEVSALRDSQAVGDLQMGALVIRPLLIEHLTRRAAVHSDAVDRAGRFAAVRREHQRAVHAAAIRIADAQRRSVATLGDRQCLRLREIDVEIHADPLRAACVRERCAVQRNIPVDHHIQHAALINNHTGDA